MATPKNLALCVTCGTQFGIPFDERPSTCRMCNKTKVANTRQEPRQFVPPSGQSWTTLEKLQANHRNEFKQDEHDGRIWSIFSKPQITISQRAVFIKTEHGNKFDCPVYLAAEDQEWLNREDTEYRRVFFDGETQDILPGVTMVKLGGHFPGSSVLHWNNNIFTGDTIGISLSGLNRAHHNENHQIFLFHYAFPNYIPLGPTAMRLIWKRLCPWDFTSVYSLFFTTTVHESSVKEIILESMKRQAIHQENDAHPLMQEQIEA
ncbi:hypothetical protein HYE67_002234 [Fusarium culmorum]|uniref:Uncharacterized protein n=1 Tax=Fusarium culmorum TaxID=5516 RepID=A0A7S8D1A4_FUSCU|nr:hypothetical protein HYE67_002234 [Fusarium culmorum]